MRLLVLRSFICLLAFAALSRGSPLRPRDQELDVDSIVDEEEVPLVEDPIVELDYGRFRGKTVSGIHHFFGIPFAAPPVGSLRLRPPRPPLPMAPNVTLNVTKHGPSCMQVLFRLTAGPRATIDEVC